MLYKRAHNCTTGTQTNEIAQIHEATNTDNDRADRASITTQTYEINVDDIPPRPFLQETIRQSHVDLTTEISANSSASLSLCLRRNRADENYVVSRRLIHSKSPVSTAPHLSSSGMMDPLLQLLRLIDKELPLQHPKQKQTTEIRNIAIRPDMAVRNIVTNVKRDNYVSA